MNNPVPADQSNAQSRKYYDHEPAYANRQKNGMTGWDSNDSTEAFAQFEAFAQSFMFPSPGVALDLGCGGGECCIALQKRGWTVYGIEYAPTALHMARLNAARNDAPVILVRADLAVALPFQDNTVDLVIDNHVLHCLVQQDHRDTFLANVYNVLRPDGIFFSTNMSAEGPLAYETLQIDRTTGINAAASRIWASRARIEREFRAAGFQIDQLICTPDNGAPYPGDELTIYATKRPRP